MHGSRQPSRVAIKRLHRQPTTAPLAVAGQRSRIGRRRRLLVTALIAVALLIAGCSSSGTTNSGNSATGSSSGAKSTQPLTLNVGVPVASVAFFPIFVGQWIGSYSAQGVKVNLTVVPNASVLPELVSGRLDIAFYGAALGFSPVQDGLSTSLVYFFSGGSSAMVFATGGSNITSITQCKSMIIGAAGSGVSVWAQDILPKLYHTSYKTISIADAATSIDALAAGRADCAIGGFYFPLLASGKAKLILSDQNVASLPKGWPTGVVEGAGIGVTKNLQAKSEAVARFLKGLNQAVAYTRATAPSNLASLARDKSSAFKALESQDALTSDIKFNLPFFAPNNGYIEENQWGNTINFYAQSLPFVKPGESEWSYASRVDMSYYDEGIGKP
jgi:ABC-type nitrate/sulfonate/bicarbonate transport system substrate-binding protein